MGQKRSKTQYQKAKNVHYKHFEAFKSSGVGNSSMGVGEGTGKASGGEGRRIGAASLVFETLKMASFFRRLQGG